MPLGDQLDQLVIAYLKFRNNPNMQSFQRVRTFHELINIAYKFHHTPGSWDIAMLIDWGREYVAQEQDGPHEYALFILIYELFRVNSLLWILEDMIRVSPAKSGLNSIDTLQDIRSQLGTRIARVNDLRSMIKRTINQHTYYFSEIRQDLKGGYQSPAWDVKTSSKVAFDLKDVCRGDLSEGVMRHYTDTQHIRGKWLSELSEDRLPPACL
jgi:hypothetical protein